MAEQPRYLTKTRFKLALKCPTKLFYTKKVDTYATHDSDPFMFELAKSGFQVGELAKFYFVSDPMDQNITILGNPEDYDGALEETAKRLKKNGRIIIAEASFKFQNCYVRADIFIKNEQGEFEFYEVKSKSYREGDDQFFNGDKIDNEWSEYLYDVAFQKWVIERALNTKVRAHLMVVDKDVNTTIDGIAKFFKVVKGANKRPEVIIPAGTKREMLGNELFKKFNVDAECEKIFQMPLGLSLKEAYSFADGVNFLSEQYAKDSKIIALPKSSCSKCEFFTTPTEKAKGLKSGVEECWVGTNWVTSKAFQEDDLIFHLWGGKAGPKPPVRGLIDSGKYLIKEVARSDFDASGKNSEDGLNGHQRREIQIIKSREKDFTPYVDKKGLSNTIKNFKYPLHFIDFETTAMALPWYKGMRPYQGTPFQFSHHVVNQDGTIEHKNQFLSFEPGKLPTFEFIRSLKLCLEKDKGNIFRYHDHENTYLNFVYKDLEQSDAPDRKELQEFIRTITEWKEIQGNKKIQMIGARNMIDMHELILKYFYSLHAKGSNSLKQILPAVIKSFPFLIEKYSQPIYGKGLQINSLNFDKKVWIQKDLDLDPYKTLDPVFDGYTAEELDRLAQEADAIADGGSAMMAYNMLQYSEIPLDQRERIRDALFRYCELDTFAMVMLFEGLNWAAEH
jgi:hypothetical protein